MTLLDRQRNVPIGELKIGEKILTAGEREVNFIGGKLREKGDEVYNFEVWRDHNYFVAGEKSNDWFLVHNAYPAIWKTLVPSNIFQNWVNPLRTQINPRAHLDDGRFETFSTGNNTQYEAIGGGDKIWADGIDLNRNALVDTKHNPGDFYTMDSYVEKPFLYVGLEDEFRRYALVIADTTTPVAELIIKISNNKEGTLLLFNHLARKYNVPTSVEINNWNP